MKLRTSIALGPHILVAVNEVCPFIVVHLQYVWAAYKLVNPSSCNNGVGPGKVNKGVHQTWLGFVPLMDMGIWLTSMPASKATRGMKLCVHGP